MIGAIRIESSLADSLFRRKTELAFEKAIEKPTMKDMQMLMFRLLTSDAFLVFAQHANRQGMTIEQALNWATTRL